MANFDCCAVVISPFFIVQMVLRMFEELGMPILHIGKCEDCSLSYFWETIPTDSYFSSCSEEQINANNYADCNEDPLYPVDVWLYDHRTRATIFNEDFSVVFPDKAVLAGQAVEWPIGGRKITPAHAAEILNSVGPSIAGFDRLHDETACIADIDVTSDAHRQSGSGVKGAGAGEYACYSPEYHNSKYFQGCGFGGDDADEKDVANPGACYDMGIHQCGCQPTRCNAELCAAADGVWTAECADHCKECAADAVVVEPEESSEEPETKEPPSTTNEESPKTAAKPPASTSSDSAMAEDEGSFASATVLHVSTIAISFGMLFSLL
jgi:hypothetical protein